MAVAHKGAISFGLVHVPIQMYKTTQDNDISFNQLCKDTHARVKYKKYCPNCNKEVKSEDIVKGYQYEKDKYVIMTNDELESIKTEKDKTIHIIQFTKLSQVDSIFYEKNYYATPEKHAEKAYELLRKSMFDQDVVAIAKTILGTKETLLALCPTANGILVKTLFYVDEIVDIPKDIKQPKTIKAELDMAKQLIKSMTKEFDAEEYHDEYQERLKEALSDKIQGNEIVHSTNSDELTHSPIDLMEALKQSVANTKTTKRKSVRH